MNQAVGLPFDPLDPRPSAHCAEATVPMVIEAHRGRESPLN